jgi:hypothetical protein
VGLQGFGRFLQDLRNRGMHPYLMGDFPLDGVAPRPAAPFRRGAEALREVVAAEPDGVQSLAAPGARRAPRRAYLAR